MLLRNNENYLLIQNVSEANAVTEVIDSLN